MLRLKYFISLAAILPLDACASITVSDLARNPDATGIHYSLPKTILQATPQADGTITMDVVYLPDDSKTFAIATSSTGSSYTFQTTITQNHLLGAVEYKEDTSAIGQQLASTAGAALAQYSNIQSAQLVAVQGTVNTAQSAVDSAQSALDAANAQLLADTTNGVSASLNSDKASVAQAQSKLQDAQTVLARAKVTAQAVTTTATTGTPIAGSTLTPSTTGFGTQTWNAPTVYPLPSNYGPVLYGISDTVGADGRETVALVAQKFPDPSQPSYLVVDSSAAANAKAGNTDQKDAQPSYTSASLSLGPPTLGPDNLSFSASGGSVTFIFSRAVTDIMASNVVIPSGTREDVPTATLSTDKTSVVQTFTGLKSGSYVFNLEYHDDQNKPRAATVKFSLN